MSSNADLNWSVLRFRRRGTGAAGLFSGRSTFGREFLFRRRPAFVDKPGTVNTDRTVHVKKNRFSSAIDTRTHNTSPRTRESGLAGFYQPDSKSTTVARQD